MSDVPPEILTRDWPMVIGLTVALFIFAYGFRGQGRINRWEGGALLLGYVGYTAYLVVTVTRTIA
jgi:cation:H+ antiporter